MKKPLIIILIILVIDQALKFWIKTNMYLGQEFPVLGSWFIIHFTENEGMAFGMKFGGEFGKLFLSLFRIAAIAGIGWYLYHLTRITDRKGLIYCVTLILAGALGNLVDSAFYGMIFSDSYARIAEFMPEGGGYSSFLHGKVVDMFYFPLFSTQLPEWLPIFGGRQFMFFRPVFNIADASISIGVIWLILFQRHYFAQDLKEMKQDEGQEEEQVYPPEVNEVNRRREQVSDTKHAGAGGELGAQSGTSAGGRTMDPGRGPEPVEGRSEGTKEEKDWD